MTHGWADVQPVGLRAEKKGSARKSCTPPRNGVAREWGELVYPFGSRIGFEPITSSSQTCALPDELACRLHRVARHGGNLHAAHKHVKRPWPAPLSCGGQQWLGHSPWPARVNLCIQCTISPIGHLRQSIPAAVCHCDCFLCGRIECTCTPGCTPALFLPER